VKRRRLRELSKQNNLDELKVDFVTTSAIQKLSLRYLWLYIPIIWFSGTLTLIQFIAFWRDFSWIPILFYLLLPVVMLADTFIFIFSSLFFTKLILILVNLIHKPKEGIFSIKKGDRDYQFWCIRRTLKKFVIWFMRNCPIPYIDIIGFSWFGVKMNFSNSILDAWVDLEFIETGKRCFIGQGSAVLSSMIVGQYLIIKKVILEDQAIVGGQAVVAPGTIVRKDTLVGAMSMTTLNQDLKDRWVYMGIPARKLKPNKYAEKRRDIVVRRDVEAGEKYEIKIKEKGEGE
jgi:carbonic anhydrase/acetyltransferase-like protein (isoleucine patch superfamily)